jgi:hypothetical protein
MPYRALTIDICLKQKVNSTRMNEDEENQKYKIILHIVNKKADKGKRNAKVISNERISEKSR